MAEELKLKLISLQRSRIVHRRARPYGNESLDGKKCSITKSFVGGRQVERVKAKSVRVAHLEINTPTTIHH